MFRLRRIFLAIKQYTQVLANLSCKEVVDFIMSRDRGPTIEKWISPPRVAPSFANQVTSMLAKMLEKIEPLHAMTNS